MSTNAATLSVLVAGPALMREGLRALLAQEEDFEVGSGSPNRSSPNVIVVCDDAPDLVRDLRARWPQAHLLVVADLSPTAAHALNELGVIGLFPLTADPDELIWAVRSVAHGRVTLHPTVLHMLIAHLAEAEDSQASETAVSLTPRERDVLRRLSLGLSDKDIAQQLYLSVRTVQSHLAQLYQKLGVHSRTEAALVALRAGWFADEPTGGLGEFSNSTEAQPRRSALVTARHE